MEYLALSVLGENKPELHVKSLVQLLKRNATFLIAMFIPSELNSQLHFLLQERGMRWPNLKSFLSKCKRNMACIL